MKTFVRKKTFSISKFYFPIVLVLLIITQNGFGQASILWSNPSNSVWLTNTNWTGAVVPTSTDIAQMGANPTGAGGIGIDMGGSTNNGVNNQSVGAFEMTSARVTSNPVIGNSSTSASGTLTFLGATVNSIPNVIIRNNSAKDITFQNIQGTGTQSMTIALINNTDNKIVQDAAGKIIISAAIMGTSVTPLTVMGVGSSEVDITNAANTFSGTVNLFGSETVFPADGCFGLIPTSVLSNAITIDGGRMTANATYTLNSNRGIKVGNTAGTSISVKTGTTILTYNGIISDLTTNGSWAKQGGNVFQIGGINIYSGTTSINNGTIRLINGNDRLPVTTTLNIGQAASTNVGNFDLNGFNQQVAGLNSTAGTNAGVAKNTVTTSTTPSTLTLSGSGSYTYGIGTAANSGIIASGITLVKNGIGLQILGDVNTYTGSTVINAGELRFSPNANESLGSSNVTLNGGTLGTSGITAGKTLSFSTLNLTDNSSINLESVNNHSLYFSSSNAASWTAAKTLTISGWQGSYSAGTSGTTGRIFVGATATDLTSTQLSQIVFFNGTNYFAATLLSNGELVPYCIAPVINSVNSASILCAGTTLNLTSSASGTLAPSYLWGGPNSFSSVAQNVNIISATPLASGIYTLTTSNGCGTFSATTSVTVNPLPTVVANTTSNTICTGNQITLSGSGANTYTWVNGITNAVAFTPTATTIYTVNGTDNNNCTSTATVSVTVNITPTLSVNAPTICAGNSVTLAASGAATYTWNTTANTSSIAVSPTSSTNYTISGSNPGCTGSRTTAITVYTLPIIPVNSSTICAGATTTLSASGAASYTWSTGSHTTDLSVSPATTANYTISGSSSQGCVSSSTAQVLVNPLPVINSVTTSVCTGGTATLLVSGASTYTWNTSSNSSSIVVTPTGNTNYTIVGTSTAGCVSSGTTAIFVTTSPNITVNSQTICTGNTATFVATGVSTYTWNTGVFTPSLSVNPTSTTIYTVNGNASGCGALIISNTVALIVNALPTVTVNSATICSGNTATLISNGASSYTWNTSSNSATLNPAPLSNLVYTVTGASVAGCLNTATSQVIVNTTPTLNVNAATICSGSSTVLTVSGANTYTWSSVNITTNTLSVNLTASTIYTVNGASVQNCVNSKTVQVLVNTLPALSINAPTICAGSAATLSVSGAVTYTWNTSVNASSITVAPVTSSNYSVSGTSSLGCTGNATVNVVVNALPSVTSTSATICTGNSGTLIAGGALTYTWSTGSNGASITPAPTANTNYTITGTSAQGCINTFTTQIAVVALPTLSVNSASICAGNSATLMANGATSYTWNTSSNLATLTVNPLSTTMYTLSGSSAQGCIASATTTVTVNALPTVSLTVPGSPLCVSDNTMTLAGSPTGGVLSGTGITGAIFNPLISGAGSFTAVYSYTDQNMCSNVTSKVINVNLCTGINNIEKNASFRIYPNPASDKLIVRDENFSSDYTIEIINLDGRTLLTVSANQEEVEMNLTSLTKGLYILKVVRTNQVELLKFIKD